MFYRVVPDIYLHIYGEYTLVIQALPASAVLLAIYTLLVLGFVGFRCRITGIPVCTMQHANDVLRTL